MAEDKHSKKHPASDQKKKQLKKKGTVPKSQDVPMAVGLAAAFAVMLMMKKFYQNHFRSTMEYCIQSIADVKTENGIDILDLMYFITKEIMLMSMPVLFAVMVSAVLSNLAMGGFILTGEQLKPNINKLNPMTKLKQWFSVKSLQDLGKSLAKIIAAFYIGYMVWKGAIDVISTSVFLDPAGLLALGGKVIMSMFWKILVLYIIVAAIDIGFQKKNFATEHKMTDKEVKDEYKNSEGDPYMKGKRRQMAQQIAMQQAQEHVPNSDVVVINPTELAIAIKYDPEISPVPFILAMGEKRIADDIRESARKHGVPVVRNQPLARALFEMCEIGDIVPADFYRPVAEVLAYVFALKEQTAGNDAQAAATAAQPHDAELQIHELAPAEPAASPAAAGMQSAAMGGVSAAPEPLVLWQTAPTPPAWSYDVAPHPAANNPYVLPAGEFQAAAPAPFASTTQFLTEQQPLQAQSPAPQPSSPDGPFSWMPVQHAAPPDEG